MRTVICLIALSMTAAAAQGGGAQRQPKDARLIFSGEVLEVGPSPGYGSGGVQAFRLIKYRARQVCEGSFDGREIVVDHLILEADEFSDLKPGDMVCLGVSKSKTISIRRNDDRLRKYTDKVDLFYIAHDLLIRNCHCSGR